MKTLYLNLLFYTACCLLLFSSCEIKDNTPCAAQYTYHYLKDWEKTTVPYFTNPDFDTLRFITPNKDTVRFNLIGIDSSWYVEDENRNPNPDGCPDWHYYETLTGKYQSNKSNIIFKVAIKAKSANRLTPHLQINLSNYAFLCSLIDFGQKNYIDYIGNYTTNGIEYHDVHYVYNPDKEQVKVYLNKAAGLIFLDDKELNQNYSLCY